MRPPGRTAAFLVVPFLVFLLADCRVDLVTSLYPVYTKDTLISDDRLPGDWQRREEGMAYDLFMNFTPAGENTYLLTYRAVILDGVALFEVPLTARLVSIGRRTYLDIYSDEGAQREQLLVKVDREAFIEALEKAGEYGIGVDAGLEELATGTFLINSVAKGSQADLGGLRAGDRVVKVDGDPVQGMTRDEFKSLTLGPRGSEVTYTVTREKGGKQLEFSLARNSKVYHWQSDEEAEGKYGVGVEGGFFDTALTVTAVREGSAAERAGIRTGDRITDVNGRSLGWLGRYEALSQLEGPEGSGIDIVVVPVGTTQAVTHSLRRDSPPDRSVRESDTWGLAERAGPYTGFYRRHWLGSHVFVQAAIGENDLSLVGLNAEWLYDLLEEQPDALSVARAAEDIMVIFSPPAELQRFLLLYGSDHEAFSASDAQTFTRVEDRQ